MSSRSGQSSLENRLSSTVFSSHHDIMRVVLDVFIGNGHKGACRPQAAYRGRLEISQADMIPDDTLLLFDELRKI